MLPGLIETKEIKLRPHQIKADQMIRDAIKRGKRRILVAAPTGYGKTVQAAYMMQGATSKGKKGAFLVDRIQLVEQTLERFYEYGLECGVVQASHPMTNPFKPVQICSVQTLNRKHRMIDADFFINDEAHFKHKAAIDIIKKYTGCIVIGLTATPYSQGLGDLYDELIVPVTMQELIDDGFLTPIRYLAPDLPNLKGVGTRMTNMGRDYKEDEVAKAMGGAKIMGNIVETWKKQASDRQTVAFCSNIKHSKFVVEQFKRAGVKAVHLDCYQDKDWEERSEKINDYENGKYQILSCATLLDTGFDSPITSCIIDAAPTQSLIKHVQKIGRSLRIHDDVYDSLILDHAGNTLRHGFVEDIVPEKLHGGLEDYKPAELVKKEKNKDLKPCPECFTVIESFPCSSCGHMPSFSKDVDTAEGELVEGKSEQDAMQEWADQLYSYGQESLKKDTWWMGIFKEKFKQWPPSWLNPSLVDLQPQYAGYVKHVNIKRARSKWRR